MEKSTTIFKKIKNVKNYSPRKSIIDNLISYSESLEIIQVPVEKVFLYSNN